MRAFAAGNILLIRNPDAVRPWQHVFDPSLAYLRLAERLVEHPHMFAEGWNIGPSSESHVPVSTIADALTRLWGADARWTTDAGNHPHEASYLKLDCSKAKSRLGWRPLIDLQHALKLTTAWYRAVHDCADIRALSLSQIDWLLAMKAYKISGKVDH